MDGYINTISTDKAKLAKMRNNSSIYIYICGKKGYDKSPLPPDINPAPGHTPPPIMK